MSCSTVTKAHAHRRRIIEVCYKAIVAAAYKMKRRYRTSFEDIDLTLDDLAQFGVLKAIEAYDRLFSEDPDGIMLIPEDELRQSIVGLALRCIACHIIDVYRMRDRRRATVAPHMLAPEIDDADVRRIELWRRIEPVMAVISPRQRAIVTGLWQGADVPEIGVALGLTVNVVQKDISAIRRAAVG